MAIVRSCLSELITSKILYFVSNTRALSIITANYEPKWCNFRSGKLFSDTKTPVFVRLFGNLYASNNNGDWIGSLEQNFDL